MLWSIACYFNPCRYATKYANYCQFRQHLTTPLLVVELAYTQDFELQPNDADRLVQLRGRDVLWQKERLLNVAVAHLPPDCDAVAWLDADIVFLRPDWATAAIAALDRYALVQPFSHLLDLPQGVPLTAAPDLEPQRYAVARSREVYDLSPAALSALGSSQRFKLAPGHAWVARREVLDDHGFYDALVLGSGDKFAWLAALGEAETIARAYSLTPSQTAHYLAWADPFYAATGGRVGYVPGTLVHLWHGDLRKRQYAQRYRDFARFEFNPYADIRRDRHGCWCWSSDKPAMHAFVAAYFAQRDEDGSASLQSQG